MLSVTDFKIFTTAAPVEVIEDALVEIFKADAQLDAFFHTIKRLPDLFAEPDRPLPRLLVSALQEAREFEPSGEAEVTMRFGLGIIYDESREEVNPGERTIRACELRIWKTLTGNALLENTAAGIAAYGNGGALVARFAGLLPIAWDSIANEPDEDGSPTSTSYLQLAALYVMNIDVLTGLPTIA